MDRQPFRERIYTLSFIGSNINQVFNNLSESIRDNRLERSIELSVEHEGNVLFNFLSKCELRISKLEAPNFMKNLGMLEDTIILNSTMRFNYSNLDAITSTERIKLALEHFPPLTTSVSETEELSIHVGMYRTPEELFNSFKYVTLSKLPNSKLELSVPEKTEIVMSEGLAAMLGFVERKFSMGQYTSRYALELDGGVSEIYIYSDVCEGHLVGDSFVKVLRIIPTLVESGDQIVRTYQSPLYFPIHSNFIETIGIEFRTSFGNPIIFTGGKTLVVLSFKRKNI